MSRQSSEMIEGGYLVEPDGIFDDDPEEICPTCKGRKTVNPLTAPDRAGLLCLGTMICPDCDGSGLFDW